MEKTSTERRRDDMLFRKNIERYCSYCQFAGRIDDRTMICRLCGVVPCEHRCRRFRYDPLKRVPPRPQKARASDGADYSL